MVDGDHCRRPRTHAGDTDVADVNRLIVRAVGALCCQCDRGALARGGAPPGHCNAREYEQQDHPGQGGRACGAPCRRCTAGFRRHERHRFSISKRIEPPCARRLTWAVAPQLIPPSAHALECCCLAFGAVEQKALDRRARDGSAESCLHRRVDLARSHRGPGLAQHLEHGHRSRVVAGSQRRHRRASRRVTGCQAVKLGSQPASRFWVSWFGSVSSRAIPRHDHAPICSGRRPESRRVIRG